MTNNRIEALEALRVKVKAGTLHEQEHGGMPMATKCYPFFGDNWNDGPWSDRDCMAAYHGSLDAAMALDIAIPTKAIMSDETTKLIVLGKNGARIWLLWKLDALISETKGETP